MLMLALAMVPVIAGSKEGPALAPLSVQDEAFAISVEMTAEQKGLPACYAYVEETYKRDPRPHVKSCYGEFLLYGKAWGAPEGLNQQGFALLEEAQKEGSANATRALAWLYINGYFVPKNPQRGIEYLKNACDAGQVEAMAILGNVYRSGVVGVPIRLDEAEKWIRRAACEGKPKYLDDLAADYEKGRGLTQPNLTRACQLYYESHIFGNRAGATASLQRLAAAGVPGAARAHHLAVLWDSLYGEIYTTKQIKESVNFLSKDYPDDAEVQVALGRVYRAGNYYKDNKKAAELFRRAADLGSDDARCEQAEMLAEGIGVKKDPAAALVILRELEAKNNPGALRLLSYYHYWGALKGTDVVKDPAKAFAYAERAAKAGDLLGQVWLGRCYEHGIGTEVNYGLAARYFRAAGVRGAKKSYIEAMQLIKHAK